MTPPSIRAARRRGQPLVALGLMLAGWIAARAALWEGLAVPALPPAGSAIVSGLPTASASKPAPGSAKVWPLPDEFLPPRVRPAPDPADPRMIVPPFAPSIQPPIEPAAPLPLFAPAGGPAPASEPPRLSGGHQIAWIAGLAQLPVPLFIQQRLGPTDRSASLTPVPSPARPAAGSAAGRWSADGWLLLREGGLGGAVGGLPPASYGASQAGAVVRYRLAPASPRRPALYLRATASVEAPRGEEAALGLAIRPVPRLPVVLAGELRATQQGGGTALRPAVSLVTELDRFQLPLGSQAEVYAQAGYVGGRGATAYVDAQARIERKVATVGPVELRAGAGAWAGAQQGASRLDVGPTAGVDFPLAGGQGRIAADWRLRVAGNARPRSGPALTLSAGF